MSSKIVRCIQNTKEGPVWMLTVGALYEVIEQDDSGYKVTNDKLYPYWYPKYLFKVEEEIVVDGAEPVEAVDWKKVFVTEEEFEPITPKNICEVLKYNGIHSDRYYVTEAAVVVGVHLYNEKQETYHHFYFTAPNWLQHLELEVGRLSPLPKKPAFDFYGYIYKHLNESDFYTAISKLTRLNNTKADPFLKELSQPTADAIIQVVKQIKDL